MKYKRIFVILSVFCAIAVSGCSASKPEALDYEGYLDPNAGPVIATIDGEDFHYATNYLFFRDFTFYPEDYNTPVPENILCFSSYGEMALGYELLTREAVAQGFSEKAEAVEKEKEGYYSLIEGELVASYEAGALEDGEGTTAEDIQDFFDKIMASYDLDTTEELADLTYPIYQRGMLGASYFIKLHTEAFGSYSLTQEEFDQMDSQAAEELWEAFDKDKNREFWSGLYEQLKNKYDVKVLMD